MVGTISRSGSGNSTAKSLNGSIQSDLDDLDGDNINVVVRVRPLNEREVKSGDYNVIQFPGDGGIWVSHVKSGIIEIIIINRNAFRPDE